MIPFEVSFTCKVDGYYISGDAMVTAYDERTDVGDPVDVGDPGRNVQRDGKPFPVCEKVHVSHIEHVGVSGVQHCLVICPKNEVFTIYKTGDSIPTSAWKSVHDAICDEVSEKLQEEGL